jgi:hypothetical protein
VPIDFSLEPEFTAKVDWAEAFVRERVMLLELLDDIDDDRFMRVVRRLQEDVNVATAVSGRATPR